MKKKSLRYAMPWIEYYVMGSTSFIRKGRGNNPYDEGVVHKEQVMNTKGQYLRDQYHWHWHVQINSHDFFEYGYAWTLEAAKALVDEIMQKHGFKLLDEKHANFL